MHSLARVLLLKPAPARLERLFREKMNKEGRILERLRRICLARPGASEVTAWGHPNFKVGKKAFAVFEQYKGEWAIAFKAERAHQQFLVAEDERFYITPYAGKYGWVSMKVESHVDWNLVKNLVVQSYRLVAPKRLLQEELERTRAQFTPRAIRH
jgi:predicted DNA-binding protein (MmcQ/YjbR family)